MDQELKNIHFSGHESFPLRHAWLPKTVNMIRSCSGNLNDDLITMVELGVGKNMARSVRHWAETTQMVEKKKRLGYKLTKIAEIIFSEKGDFYLEKRDTIWLLHYLICSNTSKNALWHYLFNYHTNEVIIKDQFIENILFWAKEHMNRVPSKRTVENDFNCCMNMYAYDGKVNNKKDIQNLLSSPLKELRMIRRIKQGEYLLRKVNTKEFSTKLFTYCLINYFGKIGSKSSITVNEILYGSSSPGRIFRLTESILVEYLLDFERLTKQKYIFDSTAGIKQVFRNSNNNFNEISWLKRVYN